MSYDPDTFDRLVAETMAREAADRRERAKHESQAEARRRQETPTPTPAHRGNGAPLQLKKRAIIAMGDTIKMKPVIWVWKYWLVAAALQILAGRPGSLKTTTAISLGAIITRKGGCWPDGTPAPYGNVVVWSGEDNIETTLLPRFLAAGGDRKRIGFITGVAEENGKTRAFNPGTDIDSLHEACERLGEVKLINIDPLISVSVAKNDSHKNAEMRRDLQPLIDLAEKTGAAVLGLHHLTKRSEESEPLDRLSGSLALGAAPRIVLLNALDRNNPGTNGALMRAKSNHGPVHGGFEFSAETRTLDDDPTIEAQRILWGAPIDEATRDVLSRFETDHEHEGGRNVVVFLRNALKAGPRMAVDVIAEGEAAGFNERALRRALKRLDGTSEKASFKGPWIWELPRGQ